MRAFLSHSSTSKGYVEDVSSLMRPGTYELDSETFDRGLLNTDAIEAALKRCTLFALFLSEEALASGFVKFETLIGRELFARGDINRILIICLDDKAFELAGQSLRFFNIVRKAGDSASTARLITAMLVSASSGPSAHSHPFLNRENELIELQEQIFDHGRPPVKALFLSGNQGAGRRSLARKVYADQFPQVTPTFPDVEISQYDGLDEIHRKVILRIRPTLNAREIRAIDAGFRVASEGEKARQIAETINSLVPARETLLFLDEGGVLTDDGAFQPTVDLILNHLVDRPYPPLTIISPRMVPQRWRRRANDVAYCAVRSLSFDVAQRLLKALLKSNGVTATDIQVESLTELGELHPYNYYRMVEDIKSRSMDIFINTANEFVEWKHRRSSDYVKKINISVTETDILSILNIIPQADFETLSHTVPRPSDDIASSLQRLIYDHVVEFSTDIYRISPALRVAVEKDRRFHLSNSQRLDALRKISGALTLRIEEGVAPIRLIDSAILAEIETSVTITAFAEALVLPSHYVWLARRSYDRQDFTESMRLARIALSGKERLSHNGKVAACRFLCLSGARTGDEAAFADGMAILKSDPKDAWTRSNIEFLFGFHERLRGNLPAAEIHLRQALSFSTDNFSAARELAAVCAARGNLEDAEEFARVAREQAPDNAFVLDILISVLIRRHGRSVKYSREIESLFDALEKVGDEGGRSFYTTRRAEFEHLWGDNKKALRLIDEAVRKTPRIFDVHRLRALILLKARTTGEAWKEITILKEIVDSHKTGERRAHYRTYVEVYSEYLQETGRHGEAIKLFEGNTAFTPAESDRRIKDIEIAAGYARR